MICGHPTAAPFQSYCISRLWRHVHWGRIGPFVDGLPMSLEFRRRGLSISVSGIVLQSTPSLNLFVKSRASTLDSTNMSCMHSVFPSSCCCKAPVCSLGLFLRQNLFLSTKTSPLQCQHQCLRSGPQRTRDRQPSESSSPSPYSVPSSPLQGYL